MGERRNLQVGLVTTDMRLYHSLVPLLETHGLRVLGLRPEEDVPESIRVLLAGPPDDERSIALRKEPEATLLAVLQRLDERPTAEGGYRVVTFGIDPGETIGLAVVADDSPLMVAEAHGPRDAALRLAAWTTGLWTRRLRVHIGSGSPIIRDALVNECQRAMPEAHVAIVSEEATSPASPRTGSRHADAAVRIALRQP